MNTQGQAVNSEQEEFTAFLINILQPSSKEDFEKKIMSLSEDDIKELYRQFKQAKNQTVMAKNGLKFDILFNYRGRCPEGTEMFMDGGCIKCRDKKNKIKIKQDGGEMKKRFEMGPGDSDSANKARPNKLQKKAFKDTKKERFCSGGRASKYQQGGGFRILPAPDVEQIKPSEVLINRYRTNYTNYVGEPSTASTTVYTDTRNPESQAVVTENSNDIFPVEAGYQGPNGYQMTYPTNSQVSNEERLTNQARSAAMQYQQGGESRVIRSLKPYKYGILASELIGPTETTPGTLRSGILKKNRRTIKGDYSRYNDYITHSEFILPPMERIPGIDDFNGTTTPHKINGIMGQHLTITDPSGLANPYTIFIMNNEGAFNDRFKKYELPNLQGLEYTDIMNRMQNPVRYILDRNSANNSETEVATTQQPAASTQPVAKATQQPVTKQTTTQKSTNQQPADNLTFAQAFAQARKNGLSVFDWNGKSYTTELAKPKTNTSTTATRTNTVPVKREGIYTGIDNSVGLVPMNTEINPRIQNLARRFTNNADRLENRESRQNNRLAKKTVKANRRFN